MAQRSIEIIIQPDGSLQIDAMGFVGPDCQQLRRSLKKHWVKSRAVAASPSTISACAGINRDSVMDSPACSLTFLSDGTGEGLYTELIDLADVGRLAISRATHIEFDNEQQVWRVHNRNQELLFQSPSRQVCLDWEHCYFNPTT